MCVNLVPSILKYLYLVKISNKKKERKKTLQERIIQKIFEINSMFDVK